MKSPHLLFVPVSDIPGAWIFARKHIMAAAKMAQEMTEEQILMDLFTCQLQLIMILDWEEEVLGAMTGRVNGDIAWIVHMGGDYRKSKELFPDFEAWATALGAKQLRIQGRLGWLRQLKNQGFKEKYVTLEKAL